MGTYIMYIRKRDFLNIPGKFHVQVFIRTTVKVFEFLKLFIHNSKYKRNNKKNNGKFTLRGCTFLIGIFIAVHRESLMRRILLYIYAIHGHGCLLFFRSCRFRIVFKYVSLSLSIFNWPEPMCCSINLAECSLNRRVGTFACKGFIEKIQRVWMTMKE